MYVKEKVSKREREREKSDYRKIEKEKKSKDSVDETLSSLVCTGGRRKIGGFVIGYKFHLR